MYQRNKKGTFRQRGEQQTCINLIEVSKRKSEHTNKEGRGYLQKKQLTKADQQEKTLQNIPQREDWNKKQIKKNF